jgi:glycosyltransferase involved in cell wall biosynthesis
MKNRRREKEMPMRILHVALTHAIETEAWNAVTLARALRGEGHFNWMIGLRGSPLLHEATGHGIPVLSDLCPPEPRPWTWAQTVATLRRALEQQRADLLMLHTAVGHMECHHACAGAGVPLVRLLAEAPPGGGDISLRWLLRHATTHLAVAGRYILDRLTRLALEENGVSILPPGIDLTAADWRAMTGRAQLRAEVRDRHGIPPGAPLLGILGPLSPSTGHDILLEAGRILAARGRDFRLLIAGPEGVWTRDQLRMRARELGLEERVALVDCADDPPRCAAAFDLAVQPTPGPEGCARHVLESMAAGVPVVASLVGILPELIDEDELLVPPGRPERLADTIGNLLDDLAWAGRLGERAFQRVQEEYSLAVLGRRAETILTEVLRARRSTTGVAASGVA